MFGIKNVLIAAVLAILLYTGFDYIYNIGYHSAEQKYTELIKKDIEELNYRIKSIEDYSVILADNSTDSVRKSKQAVDVALAIANKSAATFYSKGAECKLTDSFIDSYNSVLK